jgi:hypothetical protein
MTDLLRDAEKAIAFFDKLGAMKPMPVPRIRVMARRRGRCFIYFKPTIYQYTRVGLPDALWRKLDDTNALFGAGL